MKRNNKSQFGRDDDRHAYEFARLAEKHLYSDSEGRTHFDVDSALDQDEDYFDAVSSRFSTYTVIHPFGDDTDLHIRRRRRP